VCCRVRIGVVHHERACTIKSTRRSVWMETILARRARTSIRWPLPKCTLDCQGHETWFICIGIRRSRLVFPRGCAVQFQLLTAPAPRRQSWWRAWTTATRSGGRPCCVADTGLLSEQPAPALPSGSRSHSIRASGRSDLAKTEPRRRLNIDIAGFDSFLVWRPCFQKPATTH
jgi:hypothetical protein